MREIKFRGKRVDNGDWVYGCYLETQMSGAYIIGSTMEAKGKKESIKMHDKLWQHEVIPETVGQYTGWKDRNGVEIYEGGVVRADMDFGPGGYAEQIASIYWDEGVGGWQFNYFDKSTIEVIGNIHDNPELMGEKAELL
jgi:uncharacterized phage protein (TIGR01671 family)